MSFTKITDESLAGKGVVGMADVPGLPAAEMQRRMDEIAKEVLVPAFNRLIDELGAEGAAALIGAKDGEEKTNVQKMMEGLKEYIDKKAIDAGAADMTKSVYDPQGMEEDIFAYAEGLVDAVKLNVADELAGKTDGVTLTHAKSGTVHQLSGLSGRTGIVSAMFRATATYAEGDTITVDGTAYTAKLQSGEALSDGAFAAGVTVGCIIDTENKTVNFKAGGGVRLPALTKPAGAAQIIKGYQAIDGEGLLLTGTAVQYYTQNGSKSVKDTTTSYTNFSVKATGSVIDLAAAWICSSSSTHPRLNIALIVDGEMVENYIGDYTMNRVSVSGNVISFSIADDEAVDYGSYTLYYRIVSH